MTRMYPLVSHGTIQEALGPSYNSRPKFSKQIGFGLCLKSKIKTKQPHLPYQEQGRILEEL
jgi:hypothetical protein